MRQRSVANILLDYSFLVPPKDRSSHTQFCLLNYWTECLVKKMSVTADDLKLKWISKVLMIKQITVTPDKFSSYLSNI